MDTHLYMYKAEITKPGVQLNINISSIMLDQKHEFWLKGTSVVSLQRKLPSEHFVNYLHRTVCCAVFTVGNHVI